MAATDASEAAPTPTDARQDERDRMVEEQLAAPSDRRSAVVDARVLQAMRRVPRHRFVPADAADHAYDDAPLAIGGGQTISQPYMVGKMVELLELEPREKVLEVGTGSGYQTALLVAIGARVVSIEKDEALARIAKEHLEELGFAGPDLTLVSGDGYRGLAAAAPFDAIVVGAAPDHLPQPLLDQLAEGGRMVVPVGPPERDQMLLRVVRRGGRFHEERLFTVRFVPMTGESQQSR
jgi:protein-L-isoaspartate(D-aspartate) O-methyltransferase